MPLTKDQWDRVMDSLATIRAQGCAVCVFTPDDVELIVVEYDEETPNAITDKDALDFIINHRKHIEDRMSEEGNRTIETLLSMDGIV